MNWAQWLYLLTVAVFVPCWLLGLFLKWGIDL